MIVFEFINNQLGGLNGLIEKFKVGGVGEIIGLWVGIGENQLILVDMLQNVFGLDVVGLFVSKVGIDLLQVLLIFVQVLLYVVNGVMLNGEVLVGGQVDMLNVFGMFM